MWTIRIILKLALLVLFVRLAHVVALEVDKTNAMSWPLYFTAVLGWYFLMMIYEIVEGQEYPVLYTMWNGYFFGIKHAFAIMVLGMLFFAVDDLLLPPRPMLEMFELPLLLTLQCSLFLSIVWVITKRITDFHWLEFSVSE